MIDRSGVRNSAGRVVRAADVEEEGFREPLLGNSGQASNARLPSRRVWAIWLGANDETACGLHAEALGFESIAKKSYQCGDL